MGELALARDFGIIRAGEMLAFPGVVSAGSAKQISGSADELIRNISGMMQDLVASLIEKRTAAEFEATRALVFPKYLDAALALSSLIRILVPQQVIERLNREFFCELEMNLQEHASAAFGAEARDQAIFTVWTLRKINDFMSQIAIARPESDMCKQRAIIDMGRDCIFHAIRTRFHLHCLTAAMSTGVAIHKDVMDLMMDGLRSVVNAFGSARRMLDLVVPIATLEIAPVEWDDEDQQLLAEATLDVLPELVQVEVTYGGIYLYEPPVRSDSEQSALLVTSGSEQSGFRPWLIVSRDLVNRGKPTAIGVPLSTRTHKANSYRILIPAAEIIVDAGSNYLVRDSVALCDHVRVLDIDKIKRKVGKLSDNAIVAVGNGIAFVFDLRQERSDGRVQELAERAHQSVGQQAQA